MKPINSRNFRNKTARPYSRHALTYAVPIIAVAAIAFLTAVYYFAIRNHNVELSFDQLSAFERQVSTIGNSSIYVVEPPRKDEILSSLSTPDWGKLSAHIDFVAFVYDEPSLLVNSDWLQKVAHAFEAMPLNGYGIVLFPCGCVVPNQVFRNTHTRFNGAECTILPGFVMPNEDVAFIDTHPAQSACKNLKSVLGGNWYERYAWKLEDARREHAELRQRLSQVKS